MKKLLKFELNLKFIVILFSVITVVVGVLSLFFVIEYSLSLKSFVEKNAISLAKSLAISNEYDFSISNIGFLSSFTKNTIGDNVVYFIVYDTKGIPLSSNIISDENIKQYLLSTPVDSSIEKIIKNKFYKSTNSFFNIDEVMDVIVPISSYVSCSSSDYSDKKTFIGTIRIGIALKDVNYQVRKMAIVIAFSVMIMFVALFMSLHLLVLIIEPVKKVIKGFKEIAKGNLKYRIYPNSSYKSKVLIDSFNSMADDMDIHIKELNKEKKELLNLKIEFEDRNQELEKALEKVKNMQQDLIKAEKFATIGRLASSVAHELRNPLASIKNIAYFLSKMRTFDNDDKSKNMVQMLSSEVLRANKIITELLDYSRIKKLTKMSLDIESFFDKVIEMVPLPENIKLIRKIERFDVVLDPDKITQVIINLISNARDAMPPNGGEIIISTKKLDSICQIFVQDNACGMSKDTVKHIFDPLFTTKLKGIGLGLCIVKEIIEAHNGKISVSSEENIGTTFTIELPLK